MDLADKPACPELGVDEVLKGLENLLAKSDELGLKIVAIHIDMAIGALTKAVQSPVSH
jgi:hypothetical protein